ncbi:MAG TPA: aminodeoxychorismate/anthranilate synthase component II [Nocardioidaceae bacterium]|jgi:anthranilate synthase/aminodeoxychorismate synthase-like glutamine amidotransferase|nr:aminodeoxychorismate/anthranilate synthase component II [Nocardioidaceae bacterium]
MAFPIADRPRVVLVDHHDSYSTILAHLVGTVTGELPVIVQHDEVPAPAVLDAGFTHIVLSPGPGHPGDPADFAVGREVLAAARVPVLGVCLGMQAMVVACGGTVEEVEPAHGRVDTLTHCGSGVWASLPQRAAVVRYHSLAATSVPAVLEVTARAGSDGAVMGVRHRERAWTGVQFHPESVLTDGGRTVVADWLAGAR